MITTTILLHIISRLLPDIKHVGTRDYFPQLKQKVSGSMHILSPRNTI